MDLRKNSTFNEQSAELIKRLAAADAESCLKELGTSESGLTAAAVAERSAKYGLNEIAQGKPKHWSTQLVQAFINPFSGILVIIVAITIGTNVFFTPRADWDFKSVYVVLGIIVLSSMLRFWQEYSSNNAAEKLKGMIKTLAEVLRDGRSREEINVKEIVPGDIINLSAGDMVPADCRILHAKDLFISQAIITGESMPCEKTATAATVSGDQTVFDLDNICYMGTNVLSGTATVVALCTGNRTFLGSLSKEISGERALTSFDKGINKVSWLLVKFMLVMVPLVFVINLLTKGSWLDALLFSVAVAVGLTPEMLPMIVTANLARGAVRMSKRKVIVKHLNAIQNFGAMDILCTDKTGTLTMNKIVLEQYLNSAGVEDKEVLKWAYLNSYHQTGLKNLLDMAVLEHTEWSDHLDVDNQYKKVDEIPFDFERRRMSVILEQKGGSHIMITKGAVEEMLGICKTVMQAGADHHIAVDKGTATPIDDTKRKEIAEMGVRLNEQGLRVLLIAVKTHNDPAACSVADECDMTLIGFIGFLDPAKPTAAPAIADLKQMGIQIKVLTGDNEIVSKKICHDVGIPYTDVLLGNEMEGMADDVLAKRVVDTCIFAKLSPSQKGRIIKALQANGHTVGFMGDGINDAVALKMADVGISVDSAVDIAKESADIILLEQDLEVLSNGVVYGRQTFGNIIKYIKMTVSSNFGNMFSMIGASALLPFLPMLPIQLLLQNLLYDFSQTTIPWDTMDKDYLQVPRKWETKGLARFMFFLGPTSSVFDYVTFYIMFFLFAANVPAQQSLFQSGWFVEGLLSQTLIVHMIRTRRIPFFQSIAATPVLILTFAVMALGVWIPFSPFAKALQFQALPHAYFGYLAVILLAYCVLTQVIKVLFIRWFNEWL